MPDALAFVVDLSQGIVLGVTDREDLLEAALRDLPPATVLRGLDELVPWLAGRAFYAGVEAVGSSGADLSVFDQKQCDGTKRVTFQCAHPGLAFDGPAPGFLVVEPHSGEVLARVDGGMQLTRLLSEHEACLVFSQLRPYLEWVRRRSYLEGLRQGHAARFAA